ncbi:hypothetical protein [Fusobacterium nucleatum]|uniref:hypothetical protein n=1 Tax=Fusobacterium nucleatum TaxID=851 RepID=UPI0003FD9075|nr:hypothetical protein [Fusobacterium nucleatum]ALF24711.1 hypothetical protein RO05_10150 [Fusobacterium nucleatum subsp. nucleatum ChDC F316]ASG26053.1 hypothetical protein RN84_03725 [Fusobacterium nucleatum subsp. nucleatum]
MTTRVFKRNGKVFTETKHNNDFVEFARSNKAKWDGKYWSFSEEFEAEVIAKVTEIYGEFKNGKYDSDVAFDTLIREKATWGEIPKELQEKMLKGNGTNQFILEDGKLWYEWSALAFESGYKINEDGTVEINNNAVFVDFYGDRD